MDRCCYRSHHKDLDSAWRAQNKEQADNPVYNMVDISRGGRLVDKYDSGGPNNVRQFCKSDEVTVYLYEGGRREHLIRLSDYSRWRWRTAFCESWEDRFRDYLAENKGEKNASETNYEEWARKKDFRNDPVIRFTDHIACWDLNMRGGVGETILHLCYLNNTPIHTEIAKILLDLYPLLTLDIYEGEEYYGESCLHLAIVNGDLESVKILVAKGANIHQRATGKFFLPEDQKQKRTKDTNYKGYAYYGEYPLAFATCFGHEAIYDFLLQRGADPDAQDSFGNAVLHMAVIHNQPAMYSYAARHHYKKASTGLINGARGNSGGLTPLALASKLGRQKIFYEIMELHRIELWRFSNINCSLYPLHGVDSIGPGGHTNWNSALMQIVNGDTDDHLSLIQDGVIRQLVEEKWKTFIRKEFVVQGCILVAHLVFLSVAIYTRNPTKMANYQTRLAFELFLLITCSISFVMQIKEFKLLGLYLSLRNLVAAPFKALALVSSLLIMFCLPLRIARLCSSDTEDLETAEDTLLILAVPFAWTKLLFYAKATRQLGPLINILLLIIKHDLLPFVIIAGVLYFAVALAFYMLLSGDASQHDSFKEPYDSLMTLFVLTFSNVEYNEFKYTECPALPQIVLFVFVILIPILLFNMLIAMMGNTYMKNIHKSELEFTRQWAKIVIVLERSFSKVKLMQFQKEYTVPVANPPNNNLLPRYVDHFENRALMVIKTTTKTKAKQRKDALMQWKWMLKETRAKIEIWKAQGHGGEVSFGALFGIEDDGNGPHDKASSFRGTHDLQARNRRLSIVPGDHVTSAVEQLAWEKDLNLVP